MKLELFSKLQKQFENQNFERDYKWIDVVLYYSSFFGNALSVILAYFFVNGLISGAAVHFSYQHIVLPIFIVLFLSMFELLKRFTFANITTIFLTLKKITLKLILSILFSLILIIGSFYLALNGAKEYVNKTEEIVLVSDSVVNLQTDSLNKYYINEITKIEDRINYVYKAAESRTRKTLTTKETENVKLWEQDVKDLKKEKENKISEIKTIATSKSESKLENVSKYQTAFIILCTFIELIILIGVGFRIYFRFTSYKQTKENLDSNDNYKNLILYKELLAVLFNKGKVKINDALPSYNKFRDLINSKSKIKPSQKSIKEFLTLITHLGIVYTTSNTRYVKKKYEDGIEILNNYINLEDEQ